MDDDEEGKDEDGIVLLAKGKTAVVCHDGRCAACQVS